VAERFLDNTSEKCCSRCKEERNWESRNEGVRARAKAEKDDIKIGGKQEKRGALRNSP